MFFCCGSHYYNSQSCCSVIMFLIGVVIFATLLVTFFQPWHLNIDFVYSSLFICCKQKDFCCFSFQVPFPRLPFVSESLGLLLEAFNWSLAGLPPSPASKPVADEKFMTVCLENLTFHLKCCCSSDAAPTDGDCVCRLHSTGAFPHSGGANQGERLGRCPWLCTLSVVFTNQEMIFLGCVQYSDID